MTENDQPAPRDDPNLRRAVAFEDASRIVHTVMPLAVACLAILAVIYTMYFASDFIVPVLVAVFLAVTLRPVVRALRRWGIPESLGALLILLPVIVIAVGGVYQLSDPAQEWLKRLPSIQAEIERKLWPVRRSLEEAKKATEQLRQITEDDTAREVTVRETSFLAEAFESTWFTAAQILITVVLTFFLLAQTEADLKRSLRRLPFGRRRESFERAMTAVQVTITRFLQISAIIYACLGLATGVAMYLLGMPNPVLWGVLAMVLGFMPYLGPLIAFICIAVVALVSFDTWFEILLPPMVYGALSLIEGNFITPAVLGRQLTLSPIAVFLSMLLWTWVLGVIGALLAVPILVAGTIVFRQIAAVLRESDTTDESVPQRATATAPPV